MEKIPEDFIAKSASFTDFIASGEQNLKDNNRAFNEMYLQYAELGIHRTKRVYKTTSLLPETEMALSTITQKQIWLVLSESWCGDAAHIAPVLEKMAEFTDKIELSFLFRDENLELMDLFLTNGGRSIPKLIVLDESRNVITSWGPRPVECQKVYEKAVKEKPFGEVIEILQRWYNADKSKLTQQELVEVVELAEKAIKNNNLES